MNLRSLSTFEFQEAVTGDAHCCRLFVGIRIGSRCQTHIQRYTALMVVSASPAGNDGWSSCPLNRRRKICSTWPPLYTVHRSWETVLSSKFRKLRTFQVLSNMLPSRESESVIRGPHANNPLVSAVLSCAVDDMLYRIYPSLGYQMIDISAL